MPSRATDSVDLRAIRRPSKVISPEVRVIPEMLRSVVVLPAPLAPSTATTSPSSTFSETPCRARIGP